MIKNDLIDSMNFAIETFCFYGNNLCNYQCVHFLEYFYFINTEYNTLNIVYLQQNVFISMSNNVTKCIQKEPAIYDKIT